MQLYLIRHPQPSVSSSICYGQTDIGLAPESLRELDALASKLRQQLPPQVPVYCSPLLRCRLLAEKLSASASSDARLAEMHFGQWEMCLWDALPREQLDAWAADPLHYTIPGGESVAQMQQRILSFMQEQHKQGIKNMALVTHAGVMKILFAQVGARHAVPLQTNEWMSLRFNYSTLHVVNYP